MKKGIFVILSLILLTACDISTKGSWSAEDKAKAQAEVDKIEHDLDHLGKHKQEFIDCYLEKAEANYSSFAEADADAPGCEKLALECNDEIMSKISEGSTKGNWSEGDMELLMGVIASIDAELESLGEDKQAFIDCYVSKYEARFTSFKEANMDPDGDAEITDECLGELGF